jgi:hypothetical protein
MNATTQPRLAGRRHLILEAMLNLSRELQAGGPTSPNQEINPIAVELETRLEEILSGYELPHLHSRATSSADFDNIRFSDADELVRYIVTPREGDADDHKRPETIEEVIELCRSLAAAQGLSEGEEAHLTAQKLLQWERDHTRSAGKGWAINIAIAALETISEDDPFWPIIEPIEDLLESIADWRGDRPKDLS